MTMRIMLDASSGYIHRMRLKYECDFIDQLRTPLTAYRTDSLGIIPHAIDNGAFSSPVKEGVLWRLVQEARNLYDDDPMWPDEQCRSECRFVVMPDVPFDHFSTLALYEPWLENLEMWAGTPPLPRAFVAQDGATAWDDEIPWDAMECLFIGGSDDFKESNHAFDLAKLAHEKGKWVHVGRVNTPRRILLWDMVADSIDGSGLSRFEPMLKAAIETIRLGDDYKQEVLQLN